MEENKGMEIMYRVAEMLSELEGEDFLIKDLKFDIIEEPKNEYNIKIEVPDNYYKKYDLQKPLSIKVDREVYNDYLNNKRNCFVKMVGGKKANIGFLFGFYRENGDVSDAIKVQIIETMRECFDINNENDVRRNFTLSINNMDKRNKEFMEFLINQKNIKDSLKFLIYNWIREHGTEDISDLLKIK